MLDYVKNARDIDARIHSIMEKCLAVQCLRHLMALKEYYPSLE